MPSRPSTSGRASSYRAVPPRVSVQAPAEAFEQRHAHVALQGLQLQGHRRLAEEQGLGGARHRAQPGHLAEGAQRLEPVALVVEARFCIRPMCFYQFIRFVNTFY